MCVVFTKSQPNPADPTGTVINVNSGLAGIRNPGMSAYTISEIAAHAHMEFVRFGKQFRIKGFLFIFAD